MAIVWISCTLWPGSKRPKNGNSPRNWSWLVSIWLVAERYRRSAQGPFATIGPAFVIIQVTSKPRSVQASFGIATETTLRSGVGGEITVAVTTTFVTVPALLPTITL